MQRMYSCMDSLVNICWMHNNDLFKYLRAMHENIGEFKNKNSDRLRISYKNIKIKTFEICKRQSSYLFTC